MGQRRRRASRYRMDVETRPMNTGRRAAVRQHRPRGQTTSRRRDPSRPCAVQTGTLGLLQPLVGATPQWTCDQISQRPQSCSPASASPVLASSTARRSTFRARSAVPTDGATIQTGALLMVFGSSQTSIDLCATALLRWLGDVSQPGWEHDFEDLRRWNDDGRISLARGEQQ